MGLFSRKKKQQQAAVSVQDSARARAGTSTVPAATSDNTRLQRPQTASHASVTAQDGLNDVKGADGHASMPTDAVDRARPALDPAPPASRHRSDLTQQSSARWDTVRPLVYGARQTQPSANPTDTRAELGRDAYAQHVSIDGHAESAPSDEHAERKGLWRFGRSAGPAKKRTNSTSSALALSNQDSSDSGFFVTSFRTVSRVQETISPGPYESMPAGANLPLPPRQSIRTGHSVNPSPATVPQQRKSYDTTRASFDSSSSSRPLPQRPPLSTRPGSGSGRDESDRAMSPTISVEAFRLASNRSKSQISLASLVDDAHMPHERPRFEPDKSRRSSLKSETDSSNQPALVPPRFNFNANHSRSSSDQSLGSFQGSEDDRHSRAERLSPSQSAASRLSNAPELPLSVNTSSLAAISSEKGLPSSASSESELRLIGMYGYSPTVGRGEGFAQSPVSMNSSPMRVASRPMPSPSVVSRSSFETTTLNSGHDLSSKSHGPATVSPTHTRLHSAPSTAPSLSVQPPTPAAKAAFQKSRTVSAMAASKGKGRASAWGVDSSDDGSEQESSEDDDEVPLAQIKSRSQTDLSLPPSRATMYSHGPKARSSVDVSRGRRTSSEVEVLLESPPPRHAVLPKAAIATNSIESLKRASIGQAAPTHPPKSAMRPSRSQRRSVSALSISSQPPPTSQPLTVRSNSGPANAGPPQIDFSPLPSSPLMSSTTVLPMSSTTVSASTTTPTRTHQPRAQSLSSSASGSGSGSSAPRTPKDMSPAVSDLGLKSGGSGSTIASSVVANSPAASTTTLPTQVVYDDPQRRTVKFAEDVPMALPSILKKGSRTSVQQAPTPSRYSFSGNVSNGGRAASMAFQHGYSNIMSKSATDVSTATMGNAANSSDVFDRMKARHKAEALQAIAIGRDLNGPDDAPIKTLDQEEDDEEDDEPLASLPARRGSQSGSMLGGMPVNNRYSMMGPSTGMGAFNSPFFAPQTSFGGFSPLAVAPPGVDPFLYASLPNDQKMQLHQRSQQMMQMMAQAAMQAKAESEAGWDGSSHMSGSTAQANRPPVGRRHVPGSMSMGQLSAFGAMPMMGYSQFNMHAPQVTSLQQQHNDRASGFRNAKLPPFAPSFAMSQPMFQPSMYAGSSFGPSTTGSAIGVGGRHGSASSSPRHSLGNRVSSSALGVSRRE
ncbi:hypothetical protein OIV83_001604 [Microbotryomycetes sp. JL201]|nr:hypothetical protein OIV83_001604 [Microbotryomycetes sp. JL201]